MASIQPYGGTISSLRRFSTALTNFLNRHDELQNHLHSLISAVDNNLQNSPSSLPNLSIQPLGSEKFTNQTLKCSNSAQKSTITETETLNSSNSAEKTLITATSSKTLDSQKNANSSKKTEKIANSAPKKETLDSKKTANSSQKTEKIANSAQKTETLDSLKNANSAQKTETLDSEKPTEIESLCATNSSRELRRYITSNLTKIEKLRIEVPKALTRAHNPAQLVLNSIGRFFLQGIKAYDKDSPMVPARRVSILILEFFLLMEKDGTGKVEIDEKVRIEAEKSAVDWRKRLVSEGGLARVNEIDGRGLLLLIGGFGIPSVFTNSDIRDLVLAAKLSEIKGAVRRSSILLERVPAIIEEMVKKKDYKVADVIYTFGMENKFPPRPILASFLQESIETWNKAKKAAPGSLTAQKDASKRHLSDLRSLTRRLKEHKLNISEILPNFPLAEKIATLEKEILELNKKIGDQVTDKKRSESKPMKRSERREGTERREDRRDEKRARFPDPMPRPHNNHDYMEARIFSDRLTPIRALDNAFPGNLYHSPYEMHRPLPEIRGSGGLLVDRVGQATNGDPYRLHEDAYLRERALAERAVSQRYPELSSSGGNGLFRQTTAHDRFQGGMSNPLGIGSSSWVPASNSDLYQFADAVAERTLFGGPRDVPAVPRHSSYLY